MSFHVVGYVFVFWMGSPGCDFERDAKTFQPEITTLITKLMGSRGGASKKTAPLFKVPSP